MYTVFTTFPPEAKMIKLFQLTSLEMTTWHCPTNKVLYPFNCHMEVTPFQETNNESLLFIRLRL
jgi:hypothetical protein